ncbi:MAG TPA: signal peptidase I [Clostridia bacterium]|nr:signal peptidase I [Clostridia bacterium]HOL61520.1 signal peptidase I [Clostridia bacterium]HPO53377.1 signal peptidase I [Clostridia bacterium]
MTRSPKKAIRIILKAANIVLVVFLCVILFFSLYTAIARLAFKKDMPKVLGFSAAIVVTPSMSGTIEVNDMVIIQEKDAYSEGDIITYEKGGKYITHRIVGAEGDLFVTKGDNNDSPDRPAVDKSQIVGKVVFVIPKIGKAIEFFRTPTGIVTLIAIGVILFYLPLLINKVTTRKKVKR